jgi:hypothetical protein
VSTDDPLVANTHVTERGLPEDRLLNDVDRVIRHLEHGIHDLRAADYHADPAAVPSLSASIAHVLYTRSPLHAWTAHPKLNPGHQRREETRFDIGTTCHAILLEQREVEEIVEIIDAPDWRTKAAQEARDTARENGLIPLLADQVDGVTTMLTATRDQLARLDVWPAPFTAGKPEQTLIWQEGDVTCRALVDWLRDDHTVIDDLKTTSASASPDAWTRTMFTIGADIQTAFYLRGLKALTGVTAEMRYVVVETYPPYALSVVSVGPDVLAVADAKVDWAVARWAECLASGDWPAYPLRVAHAELPAWEEARFLEKTAREAA